MVNGTNLVTLNVSNPANPTFLGQVPLPARPDGSNGGTDVSVVENTAWVANLAYGLSQVNISSPQSPSLVRTVPTEAYAVGVQSYRDYVFVATNVNSNASPRTGVDIFRASDTGLENISFLPSPGTAACQVAIRNGNIYLTDNENLVDVATFYDPAVDHELTLQKSVDKTSVVGGDTVTVTLTMKNISPNAMHNLVVTDPVLANTSYVANHATIKIGDGTAAPVTDASDSGAPGGDSYSLNSGVPTWNFATMVPTSVARDTITLTYQVKVNNGVSGTFNTGASSSVTDASSSTTAKALTAAESSSTTQEASNTNTNEAAPASTPSTASTSTSNTSALPPVPTPADIPNNNSAGTNTNSTSVNSSASSSATTNTNTNTRETATSNSNTTTGQTASGSSTFSTSTSTNSDTNQKKANSFLQFFSNLWKKVKGVAGK